MMSTPIKTVTGHKFAAGHEPFSDIEHEPSLKWQRLSDSTIAAPSQSRYELYMRYNCVQPLVYY